MGELAERLDGIHLRVRAPGSDVEAELRNGVNVSISFGENSYEFIDEPGLEQLLASLARLLYAAWLREYRAAMAASALDLTPRDQRDHDFLRERAEIESNGWSGDGRISLSATGLRRIAVHIEPGTAWQLTEPQFTARAEEAIADLVRDHREQVRQLKLRYAG